MILRLDSHTAGSSSPTYPPPVAAALLWITSRPPQRSTVNATVASRSASAVTSVWRNAAAAPSSRAIDSPPSSLMSAMTTRAPSATKRRAVAAPMPEAAPVTIATLPSSLPMAPSLSRARRGCKQTLVWQGGTMAQLDFGLFYEIPVAAPWHERSERDAYHRVIAQAVLGAAVGFSHFWTVEHHFPIG